MMMDAAVMNTKVAPEISTGEDTITSRVYITFEIED
jgi:hypothetical protein